MTPRRELCQKVVRLNGKPARISGWAHDFAMVTDLETGLSAEWSWEAVQRVVDNGGEFKS